MKTENTSNYYERNFGIKPFDWKKAKIALLVSTALAGIAYHFNKVDEAYQEGMNTVSQRNYLRREFEKNYGAFDGMSDSAASHYDEQFQAFATGEVPKDPYYNSRGNLEAIASEGQKAREYAEDIWLER